MTPEQIEAARKAGEERGRERGLTPAQREAVEAVVKMHLAAKRAA